MQLAKNKSGHRQLSLRNSSGAVTRSVHSLVAEAFLGPRPEGQEVRHLDGNGMNNDVSNLVYGTRQQNQRDRVEHGTHYLSNRTHCPANHEYTDENTYRPPHGRERRCRTCRREQKRKR